MGGTNMNSVENSDETTHVKNQSVNHRPIAHAAKDTAGVWRDPHDLGEHLRAVARLASRHAHGFNGSDWAYLAGLWHDL
jgi:hypothetical protein